MGALLRFFVTTCNLEKIITFGIIYLFLLTGVSHKIYFFMKKVFAALAALAMMAAVVSCEYDSPDIRFQQTTNLTNDYSALVNALLDQTKTVSEKLNLLERPSIIRLSLLNRR